jgi:hypothetical protein
MMSSEDSLNPTLMLVFPSKVFQRELEKVCARQNTEILVIGADTNPLTLTVMSANYGLIFLRDRHEALDLQRFHWQKVLLVVPALWGKQVIESLIGQYHLPVVAIPEVVESVLAPFDDSFLGRIGLALREGQPIAIGKTGLAEVPLASVVDVVREILSILFLAPPPEVFWRVSQSVSLRQLVSVLADTLPSKEVLTEAENNELPADLPLPNWQGRTSWQAVLPVRLVRPIVTLENRPLAGNGRQPGRAEPLGSRRLSVTSPGATQPLKGKSIDDQLPEMRTFPIKSAEAPAPGQKIPSANRRFYRFRAITGRLVLFILFICLLFPITLGSAIVGQSLLAVVFLRQNRPDDAVGLATEAFQSAVTADELLQKTKPLVTNQYLRPIYQRLVHLTGDLETLTYGELSLIRLQQDVSQLAAGVPEGGSRMSQDLGSAAEAVTRVQLVAPAWIAFLRSLPGLSQSSTTIADLLPRLRQSLVIAQDYLPLFETLGGFDKPTTYLVLFQNPMELRATGGFIGSYGILTVSQGRMASFSLHDVYEADGQLRGHVEPPAPIRDVLGQATWYLRDANWDPDFPTTAQRSEWFLEKETGQQVAGTIGVTLQLAEALLKVTGPVTLADFGEQVTAANLFEKAQLHAEGSFFPGSTRKQDFLGALGRALINKLEKPTLAQSLQLLGVFDTAVRQRDVQIAVDDPAVSDLISRLGVGGEIRPAAGCPSANCLADQLLIVDSNLGVNKDNYYLKKHLSDTIVLNANGLLTHEVKLTLVNSSTDQSPYGGRYKGYLRLYLPQSATTSAVFVAVGSAGSPTKVESVDNSREHGRQVIGFPIIVATESQQDITVDYSLMTPLNFLNSGTYLLFWQKQAGTNDDPLTINLTLPEGMKTRSVLPTGQTTVETFAKSTQVSYNDSLNQDKVLQVDFSR